MPKLDLSEQLRKNSPPLPHENFAELMKVSPHNSASATKLVMLNPDDLIEFKDSEFFKATGRPQPWKEHTKEDLESLAKSISEHGVLEPIIVRPFNDTYQILAGRNRNRATKLAGLNEIPGIIRNVNDVTASLIMLVTNLEQRQDSLYSEKAYAYKMQMDLLGRQGKRTDLTPQPKEAQKVDSLKAVGAKNKDSRRTVAYLIRLTFLIPELLDMVDQKSIAFGTGVSLSYLNRDTQNMLYSHIMPQFGNFKKAQIEQLRKLEETNVLLSQKDIESVIALEKEKKHLKGSFSISRKKLSNYPDLLKNEKELERLFLAFLASYSIN